MATAYASLASLIHVLIRVQHPTCPASFNKTHIQSLYDIVSQLIDFLEAYSQTIGKSLERKITDAAYAAQDEIESYVAVKVHERGTAKLDQLSCKLLARIDNGYFHQDLKKMIRRMDHIILEATEVRQKKGGKYQLLAVRSTMNVGSSMPPTAGTLEFAGFGEKVNQLLERLATDHPSREVIPVVGMGGIGKSTLAVSIYNHPYVRDAFDLKAWVTISQVYHIRKIIHRLLNDFGVHGTDQTGSDLLGDELHKYLFGRKYLIILDDIWDSKAWDEIKRFFRDNENGSRVLLTTRLWDVAHGVGSCSSYEMKLLDDHRSWDLLSKRVFGQEVCPPPPILQNCGKRIARSCKGLPLALAVIGGMLAMYDTTLEYWAYEVADNISSIISREDDEHCLRILSLSYHKLPIHLKPCFLYMASFPEDYEIRVSEVTKLWAADGFLKPNGPNTLEEVALEYLNDLVNRNLIMVKKRDSRGRMKSLTFHDLVRDLCLSEARKERFLCMNGVRRTESKHRFILQRSGGVIFFPTTQHKRVARSFISSGLSTSLYDMPVLSLLRVFFASHEKCTPEDVTKLANLRFVRSSDHKLFLYPSCWNFGRTVELAPSLSFLWNLETLIVEVPAGRVAYSLPCEIWELQHIKHLIFSGQVVTFPDPPTAGHTGSVLSNLQTLKKVRISSYKVLYRIPNIKDLWMKYKEEVPPCSWNFVHCHKLETLYHDRRTGFSSNELNTVKWFPNSLKRLTLSDCFLPWERLKMIGLLPNLEVLKLKLGACTGKEWSSNEGDFQSLKFLSIRNWGLQTWRVEDLSHFPCLQYLRLESMVKLEEIPQVFGDSMTLKSIMLICCSSSVVKSAKTILEEHKRMDYDDLTVEVHYS